MLGPWFDTLSDDAQRELMALIESRVGEALQGHVSSDPVSPWLSVAQAAEGLGISEGAVRQAIHRGSLPSHRVERRLLLRVEDVDALPTRGR